MDSFENNSTLLILLLSNGTENVTAGFEKLDVKKKVSLARVFIVLFSVIGVLGNAITIPALSKSKKIRSATTAFIVNLCVADLVYCCLTFMNSSFPTLSRNSVYCTYFPFIRYMVATESIYTVVAITINRYVCVVHPSVYHSMYRPRYLLLMIFLTWLYSFLLCLLPYIEVWGAYGFDKTLKICTLLLKDGKSPTNYIFVTAVLYPGIAFLICYPRIFWTMRKTSKRLYNFKKAGSSHSVASVSVKTTAVKLEFARPTAVSSDSPRKKSVRSKVENAGKPLESDKQYEKEIRVLKVMLVVVVGFIFCYLPMTFIKIYDTKRNHRVYLTIAAIGINLSNVINPIIYVAMSSEYRKAYKELFVSIKSIGNSSTSELVSASKST